MAPIFPPGGLPRNWVRQQYPLAGWLNNPYELPASYGPPAPSGGGGGGGGGMNPYIPAGYIPGLYSSGTYTGDTKGGGGGKSPLADKNVLPATWAQRQSMGLTYVPSPYGKGQSQYMPGVGIGLQAGVGGRTNKLQPYGNWMAIVLRRTAGEAGMNMTDDELMAAWDEFQQTEGWQFGTLGGGRRRGGGKGGQTWNDFLSGRVVQGEIPVGIQQAGAGPMGWASGLVTQRY